MCKKHYADKILEYIFAESAKPIQHFEESKYVQKC